MRKNLVKIVVVLALAIILSGLSLMFTGCEEDKYPTYEIKLFDDNWNELKKEITSDNKEQYIQKYTYVYDGKPKCFNAIGYKNGKEIYKLDYTKSDFYNDKSLIISVIKKPDIYFEECKSIEDFPTEVGEYYLKFHFYIDNKEEYVKRTSKINCSHEINIIINN